MDAGTEAPAGPAVQFPDPALVAQIARVEAEQARAPVQFAWARGIGWALLLALVGGAIFAGIATATGTQLGLISILIGVGAGFGAAKGGRSRNAQIVGAVAAAIGYFAGELMTVAAIVGPDKFFSLSADQMVQVLGVMIKATFSGMGVLFLGIAVYEGWKIPRPR